MRAATTVWYFEVLRLLRTRRLIAVLFVMLLPALGIPVLIYNLDSLVGAELGAATLPPPTATMVLDTFGQNMQTFTTLAIVAVASATYTEANRPGLAVFYRTRLTDPIRLLWPRFVVLTVAALLAYWIAGAALAYQLAVLFDYTAFADLTIAILTGSVWFPLCIAVTATISGLVRGLAATVCCASVVLLAVPLLTTIERIGDWLPADIARTMGAAAQVDATPWASSTVGWPPIIVAVAAVAAVLAIHLGVETRRHTDTRVVTRSDRPR
ncbi:hypothetical protein [Nocardia sp. CNY236]|uniref:hypothetical protein n=1 Tax=Nocardia sp. CNY236 TaxID=1169152 RepID=UPI00041AF0A1|nr:hypothetical protein [Nocardia sp. CNY236]